jgi:hypothetical protein
MNTGRGYLAGCGSQTAALAITGKVSPSFKTEEFNGSTWSEGGDYVNDNINAAASGTSTAALAFGGNTPPDTVEIRTGIYDGTSWVSSANMAVARDMHYGSSQGTSAAAFAASGNPVSLATTEEFTGETTAARDVKTIDFD